jgi:hypothetical protein
VLAALAAALATPVVAQVDTLRPRGDTLPPGAPGDTLAPAIPPDTMPSFVPRAPRGVPGGPRPAGSRFVYDADSLVFAGFQTLSDLLSHVPGVHVARGGYYGQPEPVLFGGRGAAGLEIYWDGVPYLPLGRDSVFLDPARIAIGPLERIEVVVSPAGLRVYLVTMSPPTTEPVTSIRIATGDAGYALYQGLFARRWRSGLGVSLRADIGATNGLGGTAHTKFRDTDVWVRLEYLPSPRFGADVQILGTSWKRDPGPPDVAARDVRRSDRAVRAFFRSREDGLGARLQASYVWSGINADSLLAPDSGASDAERSRDVRQATLEAAYTWPRANVTARAGIGGDPVPFRADVAASWRPVSPLTLAVDARQSRYAGDRDGRRVHASAGLGLPLGFSLRGDAVTARDVQAPWVTADTAQETTDYAATLRWERSFITLEGGAGRRSAFTPIGFAGDLRPTAALAPSPETDYVTAHASLRVIPGLELSGWYADPLEGGGDFELPRRARWAATFHSKFWRKFRSGAFALHAEVAGESWSGGRGGVDSLGAPLRLPGATFIETNLRVRILDLTLFWVVRNLNLTRAGYVPGRDYPLQMQYYGANWSFRN